MHLPRDTASDPIGHLGPLDIFVLLAACAMYAQLPPPRGLMCLVTTTLLWFGGSTLDVVAAVAILTAVAVGITAARPAGAGPKNA